MAAIWATLCPFKPISPPLVGWMSVDNSSMSRDNVEEATPPKTMKGLAAIMIIMAILAASVVADVQLVTPGRQSHYESTLPEIDDPALQAVLESPHLIWYDTTAIRPAYQLWDRESVLDGVHDPSNNISGGADIFGRGNANREYPWHKPGGTHAGDGTIASKFLLLPRKPGTDDPWPIVWYRDDRQVYDWAFPKGTVIGEILYIRRPGVDDDREAWLAFEIRTRTREPTDWAIDIFRPFPHQAKLVGTLTSLGEVELAADVANAPSKSLHVTSGQMSRSFATTATVQVLPEFNQALVEKLLSTTVFESAAGDTWDDEIDGLTTNAEFHIIPNKYTAAHLGNSRIGCANCHRDVNRNAQSFNPFTTNGSEVNRDWYGRVRGSDGIFSIHPFDPGSISPRGFGLPVKMRPEFVEAGIVEEFDRERHPKTVYRKSVFHE